MMIVRSTAKAVVGRAYGIAATNPGVTLGSFVFLVAFVLVASNALMAQPGFHPDPFWMTRDSIVTETVTPKQNVRLSRKPHLVKPVSLRDVPVPTFKPTILTASPSNGRSEIVREIQKELTVLNLYHGDVDGLYGTNTKNAISQLQTIIGLQANGLASQDLLDLLRSRGESPNQQKSNQNGPSVTVESERVKEIQARLKALGTKNLDVDGIYGAQTAEAIRIFQQSHQLKVDGRPTVAVLDKLIQVGALQGT